MHNRSSNIITTELQELEKQKASLLIKLDAAIEKFRELLPAIASTWIDHEVKSCIADNSNIVARMSDEKLSQFKTRIKELKQLLPGICQAVTEDKKRWPQNPTYSASADGFFDNSLRKAVGGLGSILSEYDMLATPGGVPRWRKGPDNNYAYTINMGLSLQKVPPIEEYGAISSDYSRLRQTIYSTTEELSRALAAERFDSL